ncbi:hypothetical protein BKA70DRAFT_1235445 [Coprinopsis sp. MPI-PUGE-AT-0042]|nr:hypothetical protein BKA70DRAFT_1235445 [Coprinopsis sp. MPI-PUGE-AT-0042]
MLFRPTSLLFATVAAFSTFTAVNANFAPHSRAMSIQARAELYEAVADLIERSETEDLDARDEMETFIEVFNRQAGACPAGFYFDALVLRSFHYTQLRAQMKASHLAIEILSTVATLLGAGRMLFFDSTIPRVMYQGQSPVPLEHRGEAAES